MSNEEFDYYYVVYSTPDINCIRHKQPKSDDGFDVGGVALRLTQAYGFGVVITFWEKISQQRYDEMGDAVQKMKAIINNSNIVSLGGHNGIKPTNRPS